MLATLKNYMIEQLIVFPWSLACVAAWVIVACGTAWAVFSPKVRDTVLERIALCTISLSAVSRAYYIYEVRSVSIDAMVMSLALGVYVVVLFLKHCYVIPRWRYTPKRRGDYMRAKR